MIEGGRLTACTARCPLPTETGPHCGTRKRGRHGGTCMEVGTSGREDEPGVAKKGQNVSEVCISPCKGQKEKRAANV